MNDLKQKIYACQCKQCRAIYRLVEEFGAKLVFSESRAGRLCELAVVSAEGDKGMCKCAVVKARRMYALHLNLNLVGSTSNSNFPVHIKWAVNNSNHNPKAVNRINIGGARASFLDGRYFLL